MRILIGPPEVLVNSAANSMCLQTKIHILAVSKVDIILVEDIIQTLIKVLKVEQNHCSACVHANLNLVDVPTHLKKKTRTSISSFFNPLLYQLTLVITIIILPEYTPCPLESCYQRV